MDRQPNTMLVIKIIYKDGNNKGIAVSTSYKHAIIEGFLRSNSIPLLTLTVEVLENNAMVLKLRT